MALLTADQIRLADDVKKELLSVPEWDGDIYVRVMTGAQRDAFEQACMDRNDANGRLGNIRGLKALLVQLTACDEQGNPLFDDESMEWLQRKSCAAIERIFAKAKDINRFTDEAVEELAGN